MSLLKIYTDDLQIAKALIKRDEKVTRAYFYKQCYPLFKSIYDNYHTDCNSCMEFINEIYIVILAPNKSTGKCQMDNFRGESTLTSWLKSVCLFYCYNKYQRKIKMPILEQIPDPNDEKYDNADRLFDLGSSNEINLDNINREDIAKILGLMPNKRYAELIRLRYLDQKSNDEVACIMNVDMDNYYNLQLRAKVQYKNIFRKEEQYG